MGWFRDWKISRCIRIGDDISPEEFEMLYRSVKHSNSVRHVFGTIWKFLIGICTIIAAVFSVLSYFK